MRLKAATQFRMGSRQPKYTPFAIPKEPGSPFCLFWGRTWAIFKVLWWGTQGERPPPFLSWLCAGHRGRRHRCLSLSPCTPPHLCPCPPLPLPATPTLDHRYQGHFANNLRNGEGTFAYPSGATPRHACLHLYSIPHSSFHNPCRTWGLHVQDRTGDATSSRSAATQFGLPLPARHLKQTIFKHLHTNGTDKHKH